MDLPLLKDPRGITAHNGQGRDIALPKRSAKERSMTKVTLIGIDTAKQVFHLVGIDAKGHYVWRRTLRRTQLLDAGEARGM